MLIYLAGPYSGKNEADIEKNITSARQWAIKIWEAGHVAITPHLNTAYFHLDCHCSYDDYLAGDLVALARCDAIFMLPGWDNSTGATSEHVFAIDNKIPIYHAPDIPTLNLTEERCPRQVNEFAALLGQMYRMHLQKNADYSPANILGTGEIGLVTRLWDKMARLMNLTGFKISVQFDGYQQPKDPVNESINDTLLDAANYCIIGLLLRRGVWGK